MDSLGDIDQLMIERAYAAIKDPESSPSELEWARKAINDFMAREPLRQARSSTMDKFDPANLNVDPEDLDHVRVGTLRSSSDSDT